MTFYYFVNVTKNLDDIAGKTNIKNRRIISLFEAIIDRNAKSGWDSKDIIMAFPENDGLIMRYQDGDFEFKFECDEIIKQDDDKIKKKNCTYCDDILVDYRYGNICGKHVPSYALWDHTPEDPDSFYEELSERKLATELDVEIDIEYYNQGYEDYNYEYDRYDYDYQYDYECDACEESCY